MRHRSFFYLCAFATTFFSTDITDTACANCYTSEFDNYKLERYSSRDCQISDCSNQKMIHEELFIAPPERESCPICMYPLPFDERLISLRVCCGKIICTGCDYARAKDDSKLCEFCRTPGPTSDKEVIQQLEKGVERRDPNSILQLAGYHKDGEYGLKSNMAHAVNLYDMACRHGSSDAYQCIGSLYRTGNGVKKNLEKAKHYYKLGAMKGSVRARHNLAYLEVQAGNYEQALKHLLICVRAGFEPSLKSVGSIFQGGFVTREEYEEALEMWKKHRDDSRSTMRKEAEAYSVNPLL